MSSPQYDWHKIADVKEEISFASNGLEGSTCQLIGPSLAPSRVSPLPRKRLMLSAPAARSLRSITNLGAFTLNMNSSGVASCHFWNVAGFCKP